MKNKKTTRSPLRLAIGSKYFCFKRRIKWIFDKKNFSKKYEEQLLPFSVFKHKSILKRELKEVDMWLQENKISNLSIAIKKLDGLIIQPNQIFSYWYCIGKPTKRKGYLDGMVLSNGGFKAGVGGGLCQMSNLIFWMTIHTDLTVIERHRHSYDVFPDSNRTIPFGSGATCYYNYLDLQIKNETDEVWQLHVYLKDGFLNGEWLTSKKPKHTYKVYETNHTISKELFSKYVRHNEIYRKKYDEYNNIIDDLYITENHALMMYEPFLEDKKTEQTKD